MGKIKRKNKRSKLTLAKVNKKVNSLMDAVEIKHTSSTLDVNVTNTPLNLDLNVPNIIEGTSQEERVGQKIVITKIQLKGQIQMVYSSLTPSLNDAYNQCRFILIMYQSTAGSSPVMDDILEQPGTAGSKFVMNSLYKKNPKFKYRVLYDKVHNLYWRNASGYVGGCPNIKNLNITRKLNHEVHYSTTGLITGWIPLLMIVSDSGALNHPQFAYTSRISYKDI